MRKPTPREILTYAIFAVVVGAVLVPKRAEKPRRKLELSSGAAPISSSMMPFKPEPHVIVLPWHPHEALPRATDLVEAVVQLPRTLHAVNVSPVDVVVASGYLEDPSKLTKTALMQRLQADPSLIEDWFTYSGDQMSSDAWFVVKKGPADYMVGKIHGAQDRYSSPEEACAVYIQRDIAETAEIASNFRSSPP